MTVVDSRVEAFDGEVRDKNLLGVIQLTWVLFAINPVFAIVDRFVFHEHLFVLLGIRLLLQSLAIAVLVGLVVARDFLHRFAMAIMLLTAAFVAWSIEAMVFLGQGYGSPYYAGVLLAVITAGYVALAPRRAAIIFALAVYLPFVVPALLGAPLNDLFYFATHQLMLASTLAIVVVGMGFRYSLEQRSFADRQQLKELDRAKNRFFANISHELRTPLTLVLAPIEAVLEDSKLEDDLAGQLKLARRNAMRLLRLVDDLLELSRLESAGMRLRVAKTSVRGVVADLVERTRPLASRKRIDLALDLPEDAAWISCDPEQLERVLLNVLANALKFTGPDGKILVRLSVNSETIEVSVSDNGEGIPVGHVERIFDRFHQVDPTGTRRHGGTGIGLAFVKEIVELHGGAVTVESELGVGTTIFVRLPVRPRIPEHAIERRQFERLVEDDRRAGAEGLAEWHHALRQRDDYRLLHVDAASERRLAQRVRNPARSERVLIVEDNADMIQFIAALLSAEYEVLTATDGEAGFEVARARRPDLIISDVMMPRLSGFDLVRRLRDTPEIAETPVILLTARGDSTDKVEGREGGADIYLTKPFQPAELRAAVRRLLLRQEQHADRAIEGHDRSLAMLAEGAAHEVLNPLGFLQNAMFVMSESARELSERLGADDGGAAELQQQLDTAYAAGKEGVRRVRAVVEDLRRFSRGGGPGQSVPADINDVVRRVCTLVGVGGIGINLTLVLEATNSLSLRPGQMEQVVLNLFINAQRAGGGECGVTITTWNHERGGVGLEFHDDGPGIAPTDREKVFTPFYSSTPDGSGTGLGLSMARRIVREHGGTIVVSDGNDAGATFVLWLPGAEQIFPFAEESRPRA